MNSLLEDLIGFARENIEKAGVSFAESNQRDRNLINAYKSGAPVDPAQRQAMAEEYINQASPMSTVGGMISPKMWRSYSPESKAVVSEVANRSPQKFKEVLDAPVDLMIDTVENLPMDVGGRYRPRRVISPTLDAPARIELNKNIDYRQNDRVLEHELTHYLNDIQNLPSEKLSRVAGSDPDDAWTFARLMQEKLPADTRGSLDRVIAVNTMPPAGRSPMMQAFMEAFGRGMDERLMKPMGPDRYHLQSWLAKDEALAHLAQAAAKPNASTEMRKLAKDLGVSFEDKTKEVLFGGKDSPKWNPRDVELPPRHIPSTVNIPRGTASPGALEAFAKLKQERGLDATFNKFQGPAGKDQAVKVLKDMQDEGTRRMMQMEQSGLSNAEELPRASMDRVIANILDKITGKLVGFNPEPKGFYHRQALQGGVNGMRRALGDLQSINKVDPRDYMRLEDFRALMQHLDKNGLLTDQALQSHLDKWTKQSNVREVRPAPLRRLRRFIEETKE